MSVKADTVAVSKPVNPSYVQVCHAPYPVEFWTKFRVFINDDQVDVLYLDSAQNRETIGKIMREIIGIFNSPDRSFTDEQVETIVRNNYFYTAVIYYDRPGELRNDFMKFRDIVKGELKTRKEKVRNALVDIVKYITRFCNEKLKDSSGNPIMCEVKDCVCRIDLSKELLEETAPVVAPPTVPSGNPDERVVVCGTCGEDRERYWALRRSRENGDDKTD